MKKFEIYDIIFINKINLNKSEKNVMAFKQVLKNGKCAKCGKEQEFMVVEETLNPNNEKISLEQYLHFKNPTLNVCKQCGYVAFNLSENINPYSTLHKEDITFSNGLISLDSIYQVYAQNSPLDLKCIRVFAKIFDLHEFSIKSLYVEHLHDDNFDFQNVHFLHQKLLKRLNEACEIYQKTSGVNNYVNCFQIELLSRLGKTKEATNLLNSFSVCNDLNDFLLESIEMGYDEENEQISDGGEN